MFKSWRLTGLAKVMLWALVAVGVLTNSDTCLPDGGGHETPIPADPGDGPSPKKSSILVGSWNLEWLGTPSKRKAGARSQESLDVIAEHILSEKPAVMVLNEINTKSSQWRQLRGHLIGGGYRDFAEAGSQSEQNIVVLYSTQQVSLKGTMDALPMRSIRTGDCSYNPRSPLIGNFKAGDFDFTLVGVHFKSKGARGCAGAEGNERIREEEASRLTQALLKGQKDELFDDDIVLLGDLNGETTDRSLLELTREGLKFLTQSPFVSPTSGRWSYRKGKYSHALDHILILPASEREYVQRSAAYPKGFSQLQGDELAQYHRAISDHAPVWARFYTHLGDDD